MMTNGPRRLRYKEGIRALVRETAISADSLILPLFVKEGRQLIEPIAALPGHNYYSPDCLDQAVEEALAAGVSSILLFGLPAQKDELARGAYAEDGVVQEALRAIKQAYPQVNLITDVCLCEYTANGHCGLIKDDRIDNDLTLPYLARTALSHAQAGADMIAPSDMMDGRVAAIRQTLAAGGYDHLPLMSYAAKYASSFYGPFREVAQSAPAFGDRKSYQMDYHNRREALKEVALDLAEGADIIMVKPALAYLDIIREVKEASQVPLCAYSVSGEYAMIKQAGAAGLIDEYAVMCESAVAVYRAGADMLISYYACQLAQAIRKGDIG